MEKRIVSTISPEGMDGFDQTYTAITSKQRQKLFRFFVTLTPFSRSHKVMSGNGLSAHCIQKEWMNTDQIGILMGHGQELMRFWRLYPIFMVTRGLRMLESCLSVSYILKEYKNIDQSCTDIFWDMDKN